MGVSRIAIITIFFTTGITSGVFSVSSSWGIAAFIVVVVGSFFIRRKQSDYYPLPVVKINLISKIMRFSFGNYLVDLISGAPLYVLPLMVVGVLGAEANAYFFIAFTAAQAAYLAPTKTAMALFGEGTNEYNKLRTNIIRAIKLDLILIPVALAVVFFFGDKLLLLAGKEYNENSYWLLVILSLSAIPLSSSELYIAVRRAQTRSKPIVYMTVLTTVLQLTISYILMSRMGIIGVGLGFLSGLVVGGLVVTVLLWKEFRSPVCRNTIQGAQEQK